jgi:hypothetical protein
VRVNNVANKIQKLFMKKACNSFILGILTVGIAIPGCSRKPAPVFSSLKDKAMAAQLKSFVDEKRSQANSSPNEAAPGFAPFFAAAEKGDWLTVSNVFEDYRKHPAQYENTASANGQLDGPRWAAVLEIWGAFHAFSQGEQKYSAAFGNGVIQSIPPGSIYFGGTDPGRFVVTAMEKSQVNGDPFFALTQNALADGGYLDYLRSIYGDKLYIPTTEDSERCFQDYREDAQRRIAKHQLRPGEKLRTDANGHVQVSGQVAVMDVNARLVRVIIDHNTNNECYIEESFPLDSLYPYLEPHGLIMKINREPMAELSEDILQTDHDYWTKYTAPLIGDWLTSDTTVAEVAAFAEKTYAKHDLRGFKGDRKFIESPEAQKAFSKLRSSIGGLYSWRIGIAPSGQTVPAAYVKTGEEKERLSREIDFAFKQAFALCPVSPEAVYRYANFLVSRGRKADALLIAQTAAGIDSKNYRQLVGSLSR